MSEWRESEARQTNDGTYDVMEHGSNRLVFWSGWTRRDIFPQRWGHVYLIGRWRAWIDQDSYKYPLDHLEKGSKFSYPHSIFREFQGVFFSSRSSACTRILSHNITSIYSLTPCVQRIYVVKSISVGPN